MAMSLLKRYRNEIKAIQNKIKVEEYSTSAFIRLYLLLTFNVLNESYTIGEDGSGHLGFNYNFKLFTHYNFENIDFIEDNSVIYFGIDLTKIKLDNILTGVMGYSQADVVNDMVKKLFIDFIAYYLLKFYTSEENKNKLFKLIFGNYYSAELKFCFYDRGYMTNRDYDNNLSYIKESKVYQGIFNSVKNVFNKDVKLKLDDYEFKKLKNRYFFPVLIFTPENSTVDFCGEMNYDIFSNSRRGRVKVSLSNYLNTTYRSFNIYAPWGTVTNENMVKETLKF